ncbi:unnamed protein product (macronuclear) [Paramecium tetraurelia]|uniref:PAZ domain-containing protein n=1 Tax=Paramecium tetraurelia TaxID=5888 RepID=A0CE31_PARTE|nr:uncharacterized protein GSPATT00007260001 [Paramecium tetraurelia]CAK69048.1 unnamed protein product [Paramecium tetraurelia]|eukprot:XP_001436445.1 hypothetical protein (macronuclear) [Paramecium tetraurelia strain d4-2]
MQQQSNTICQLPKRPQRGENLNKDYRMKILDSNHFELQFLKDIQLHIYKKEVKHLFASIKNEIVSQGIQSFCITGANIWSFQLQRNNIHITKVVDETKLIVDIKYVKTINLKDLTQYNDQQSINISKQAINAILKQIHEKRNMKEFFGKGKFYESVMNCNQKFQEFQIAYLKGFRNVYCPGQNTPLLQIDYSTKLINTDSILNFIYNFQGNRKQLQEQLQHTSGYAMYSKRFYRILGIDFSKTPQSLMENGKMTYYQYYQQKYKITIYDQTQPLLVH